MLRDPRCPDRLWKHLSTHGPEVRLATGLGADHDADTMVAQGGTWSTQYGRGHYESWGGPQDTLSTTLTPTETGAHLLQAVYGNGSGQVSSGVTCATKWLTVHDADGLLVGEGPLVMPHLGNWSTWRDSSFVSVFLEAGVIYEVTISDGFNMSHLAHYEAYVDAGGGPSASNFVNIAQLKLLRRGPSSN